jgi:hypothetical protein
MALWFFEVVLAAIGLIWVGGSLVISAFRPWRHEFRLDRREARRIGHRRQAPDAV